MTKDEFDQFYLLVQNDRSAAERLKRSANRESFFTDLVAIGREKGYNFTATEVRTLAKAKTLGEGRELTDAELEAVAGGGDCGCMGTWEDGKSTNW